MPRPVQPQRKNTPNRRATRPNKAQLRAAQVRAEQTAAQGQHAVAATAVLDDGDPLVSDAPLAIDVVDSPVVPVARASRTAATSRSARAIARHAQRTPGPRVQSLSRAQEFAFIRADMRRLLITAGAILAIMLILLFFVDH